jgi:hypothetical protein
MREEAPPTLVLDFLWERFMPEPPPQPTRFAEQRPIEYVRRIEVPAGELAADSRLKTLDAERLGAERPASPWPPASLCPDLNAISASSFICPSVKRDAADQHAKGATARGKHGPPRAVSVRLRRIGELLNGHRPAAVADALIGLLARVVANNARDPRRAWLQRSARTWC